MSVFAEFHKAWRTRFPGKDLPGAWEEDVRANLTKHRARAAVLREDLEKEQFYVEYLERLVEDVQLHSRGGAERGEGEGAAACGGDNVDEVINSVLADEHFSSCTNNSVIKSPSETTIDEVAEQEDEIEDKSFGGSVKNLTRRFNKNTNTGRSGRPPGFLRSTSVPATTSVTSQITNATSANHRLSSTDVASPFVTVIPISGDGNASVNNSSATSSSATSSSATSSSNHKSRKPPPVVPPKHFRQRPPSLGDSSGAPEPRPPAPLPHGCILSPSSGSTPSSFSSNETRLYKSSTSCSGGFAGISSYGAGSSGQNNPKYRRPGTPPLTLPPNGDGYEDDDDTEEPLYDTVAPDEELEEDSPFDTLKSGGSGGSLASKSGCSGGGLSSPSGGGSPAPLNDYPNIESPKHCNYVNLDFFLKRRGRGVQVEEAEDSDCEEEASTASTRGLLRSLSSDHEEDYTGHMGDIDSGVYGSSVESTSHMPSAPEDVDGARTNHSSRHLPLAASGGGPRQQQHLLSSNTSTASGTTNHLNGTSNNNNIIGGGATTNASNINNAKSSSVSHHVNEGSNNNNFTGTTSSSSNNSLSSNSTAATAGGILRNSSNISSISNVTSNSSNVGNNLLTDLISSSGCKKINGSSSSNISITKSNSNKSSSSSNSDSSNGPRWVSLSDVAEDPVLAEAGHLTMCRCITASILESENIYLECLQVVLQYMKALKATLTTSQPVISPDDFSTVFYRIPDLYTAHKEFLDGLKEHVSEQEHSTSTIGDLFQALAQKLEVYSQFLGNYSRAVDTVRRCSNESPQFSAITRAIKLKSLQGQAHTLEELLHRPVARVQKNALVLHDLLKHTPDPDSGSLREALRLFQNFLSHFSLMPSETMYPLCDRPQRHLVRNSFIVELVDGHRKLRHLFLFNDVLLCAKYKATNRADKFTFDLKWFISLHDILVLEGNSLEQFKEASPPNLVSLKSQAATVRDQLRRLEGHGDKGTVSSSTSSTSGGGLLHTSRVDKLRKRLSELEAQLILASPALPWRVGRRGVPAHPNTFLLSSQYERQQWTEALNVLQNNSPGMGGSSLTAQELQGWITAYRSFLKTNMGSFLLRSGRDEPLLLGDLHIIVGSLKGLACSANIYLCFEVDSYGHFFRKAKTRPQESPEPNWNQDFIIELEGSQTLRVLCYENTQSEGLKLRGKAEVDLSTSWLCASLQEHSVVLQGLSLSMQLKYLAPEATLRRVPTAKPQGLFGAPISYVSNREKRSVPFIVTRCVREVERRGVGELGIYRVSGMASDITRLKKSFESNPYEAEQLIKEVDIHSVTGLLKLYLRELPEALFTNELYPRFFDAYVSNDAEYRRSSLLALFTALPQLNQSIIVYLLEHLVKVHDLETINKMTLHNLATVFGPTLVRPAIQTGTPDPAELLAAGTVDVMAQAGILHFFLNRRAHKEPIQAGAGNS